LIIDEKADILPNIYVFDQLRAVSHLVLG